MDERKWFALYTKPRHEFKAEIEITSLSIENYLPTVTRLKQWSDRKKKVTEPLLRGYILIKATEKERINALQTRSVLNCVSFKGKPAAIPQFQIDNLKKMMESDDEFYISEQIKVGTKVRVTSGPFQGVEGIVYNTDNVKMLAITIDLLNRSVSVKLPPQSVTKIRESEK
jgi:transcription antitermination factor NusG